MKLITTQDKINTIAERWRTQYYLPGEHWKRVDPPLNAVRIYSQLLSLSSNATAAQVEAIIGNSSWTSLACDECRQNVDAVICLGSGECTICVCFDCLLKAVNIQP